MALDRYLQEEVALDHADGHISRREALKRLAKLGLGAAGRRHAARGVRTRR